MALHSSIEPLSHDFLNGGNDAFRAGDIELFERRAEWHRCMRCRDPLDGRIQFGESFVGNACRDVCGGTAPRAVLVNDSQAGWLCERCKESLIIQRGKGRWGKHS